MTDSTPLIVLMPGAHLMHFEAESDGLRVTCPGCRYSQVFRPAPGRYDYSALEHENGCPVHARIKAAVTDYEGCVVRRG